jgi:hypothetical protein
VETIMRKPATKKPLTPGRSTAAGAALAKASAAMASKRPVGFHAADLGGGYLLVKVPTGRGGKAGAGATAFLDTAIKPIPPAEVKRVIGRIATLPERASSVQPVRRPRLNDAPGTAAPALRTLARAATAADIAPANAAFMEQFIEQGLAARVEQLAAGRLLRSADLCRARVVTRQAVSKAVSSRRLFWVEGPSGAQLYPTFFSKPAPLRRLFEKVSVQLGELPGDSKWQFFTTPKLSLDGQSPERLLERHGASALDAVLRAASAFLE